MTNTHPELVIIGHSNAVTALAFSADGKTLVSGSYDQTAIVWEVQTAQMRRLLHLRAFVNSLVLTPDGTILVTDDGHVWDAPNGRLLRKSSRCMAPLACSPDGRTLAYATFVPNTHGSHILLTDIRTGRTRHRFPCGENQPDALAFSSDGELIAVSGYDSGQEGEESTYITTVCNLRTGDLRKVLHGQSVFLFCVNLGPEVRLVAVSPGGEQLWNAETEEVLKTFEEPQPNQWAGCNMSIALCPTRHLMAVGTWQGVVSVYNVDTSERLWHQETHRGWVRAMAFTNDGQMLATAGEDHTVRLWNAVTGELLQVLGRPAVTMEALAFAPDGASLTTLSNDKTARVWNLTEPGLARQEINSPLLTSGAPLKGITASNLWNIDPATLPTLAEIPNLLALLAFSADGTLLALQRQTDRHSILSIWSRQGRSFLSTLVQPCERPCAAFSPDNRFLAVSSEGGLQLFLVATGAVWQELQEGVIENLGQAGELVFSPDGRTLAVGHWGFALSLWDVQTGKRKRVIWAHRDSVGALAFSPDGNRLAYGTDYATTVWLKSLGRSGKEMRLLGHTANMRCVTFSPDGTQIATGAADGTVRLWEAESGRLLTTFLALPGEEWVIYTPEGDYTSSAGAEQYILWRDGTDLVPANTYAQCFRNLTRLPAPLRLSPSGSVGAS